jgi:hypothetical protein
MSLSLLAFTVALLAPAARPAAPNDELLPEYDLELDVVSARSPVTLADPVSSTKVRREEIRDLPLGDQARLQDVLAETVPGAVTGAQQRLFFRQSEFGTRYELDGVLLPDSPSISMGEPFSLRDAESVEVLTGALPARYGERMLSLVRITTPVSAGRDSGELELGYGSYATFEPQATTAGASAGGALRWFASAGYSRTDRGLGTPQPLSDGGACGVLCADQDQGSKDAVHDGANSNSELLKLDWSPVSSDRFTLIASHREAFFQIPNYPAGFQPTDPFFQPGFTDAYGNGPFNYVPPGTDDSQHEHDVFLVAAWKHAFSARSNAQLSAYYSFYSVDVANDPANDLAAFTLIPGSDPSSFAESRHLNGVGVQGDYSLQAGGHRLGTGFKARGEQASGYLQVTGVNQATNALATYTDASPESSWSEGAYLQDDYAVSSSVLVQAGLRFDAVQYVFADASTQSSEWEPRVGVSWIPVEGTKLHAFVGRMFLPPWTENLREAFSFFQAGAAAGPFDIQPERATYLEAGIDQRLTDEQVLKLTAYYKDSTDLLDDAQLFNTSLSQPFNWAHGYALGFDASLSGRLGPYLSEFVAYGFGTARGADIGAGLFAVQPDSLPNPGQYQTLDHVQRQTLSAGLLFRERASWASVVGLFGSGLPTGPANSVILPSHLTFDLSAGTDFFSSSEWARFRLSADLVNLFDDVYPISVANGFNGSYYAAGRTATVRLAKAF